MKNLTVALVLLLCFASIHSYAQNNEQTDKKKVEKPKKIKFYLTWIEGEVNVQGIFYEATDSSIIILPRNDNWQEIDKTSLIEISVKKINKIKLRRLYSVSNGAIIGFVPMAIAGGGFVSLAAQAGDDDAEPGDVIVFALLSGAAGAGIGAAIGSIKTKYKIDYSLGRYMAIRRRFEQKSIKVQAY